VITPLPDGTARVEWSTDEPTKGSVSVGRSAGKLVISAADSEATRAHSLVVVGLDPDATYWFRTSSADRAGNAVLGKAVRVATPAAGVGEQYAASFRRGKLAGQATIDAADLRGVTLTGDRAKKRQGTFTSGVLDAQAMVDWDQAVTRMVVPKGSSAVIKVRTGSTATPDGSWTAWKAVSKAGRITGSSRLIQYQVTLTSAAKAEAPAVLAVGFTGNGERPEHEGEIH